jgi:hypothetical protein
MEERPERPLFHDLPSGIVVGGHSMRMSLRFSSGAAVRLGFFFALIAWSMAVGKDLSWDVVNHQLYLPYAWLSGRIGTDLFAASGQAYQNPLGYIPFYGMVRAGFPSWLIGLLLSATHALVVWPLDRIARLFWPSEAPDDFWCRVLALGLCCVAPIFLIHDGSTSIDPIACVMLAWALALTLQIGVPARHQPGDDRRALIVGALLGLASAIKLSNAVLAVALCAVWIMKWLLGQVRLRTLVVMGAGMVLAFAAGAGWWMAWLFHEFGNPIFPLYNNVFHSPYAPQQAITALRFVPETAWGMVTRLAELAEFSNFVSFEVIAPDFRPVLAAGAVVLAALVLAWRGGWRRIFSRATWSSPAVQLGLFMLIGYVLWIRSSGNARYAIVLFVLVGIPLVRALQRALPLSVVKILLLTVFILQAANYAFLTSHRFTWVSAWDSGPYIDYSVPRRLREEPFLHLSIGIQTHGSLAPYLAPGGAMSNPIGMFSIGLDGPLGERFRALLDKWHGRTRLLFDAPDAIDPADVAHVHHNFTELLYRIGLDVDWSDCEKIKLIAALHEDRGWATQDGLRPDRERDMLSCAVLYRTDKDPVADQQLATAKKVFDILEAACPRNFSPSPFASDHNTGVWQRHYMNTEEVLTVSVYEGVFVRHFRSMQTVNFGTIEDVLNHRAPIHCPRMEYQTPQ